jgi:hypothetical protein
MLSVNSLTTDILRSDITNISPKTVIYKVKNQINSSNILYYNKGFLKSTNYKPATRHNYNTVKKQASTVKAFL